MEDYIDTFKKEPKNRLILDIEKTVPERETSGKRKYFLLKMAQCVINPERHGKESAIGCYNNLKRENVLYLVEKYIDCRMKCYETPKYEHFRKFREELWAKAKAESVINHS